MRLSHQKAGPTNNITVTADTEIPSATTLADNTANPTVPSLGSFNHIFDGATWDRTPGNSTDGTLVNLGSNNDVTVTGSVTANAGTNLNTSLLALESGGNLAAAAASLSVLDDWDETNRAAVNTIAGQVGVQGGSGIITALTQRVVLATDQPVIPVSDNGGSLTVDATDLDIRNLVFATDKVDVTGSLVAISELGAATATLSNVAGSASSVTLLAANTNRRMAMFYNDSTAILYLKFGSTASTTSFTVKMFPEDYYELPLPVYTGIVTGIWASATGACRVTETTT